MTFKFHGMEVDFVLDRDAIRKLSESADITEALERVGQIGEREAKALAPVDTGHLRRSITHELGKAGLQQYVRIGTNVSYAIFQELGTRFHPAHPFLRPSIDAIEGFLKS